MFPGKYQIPKVQHSTLYLLIIFPYYYDRIDCVCYINHCPCVLGTTGLVPYSAYGWTYGSYIGRHSLDCRR